MAVDITIKGAGGEYMEEVTVVEWRVCEGDAVAAGDVVAVVETAKAATDVEAPAEGVIAEILVPEGGDAAVGTVIGRIERAGEATPATREGQAARGHAASAAGSTARAVPAQPASRVLTRKGRPVASPLARKVAGQRGVDLARITGTGPGGRIKRRDVEGASGASTGTKAPGTAPEPASNAAPAEAAAPARRGTVPFRAAGLRLVPSRAAAADPLPAPVVLLHGFGADHLVWRSLIPALDPRIDTVSLDLPGHGQSASAAEADVAGLARAVERSLDIAGHADCHLVAHSLGAAVALALLASGGVAARSLTLIAPAGLGSDINGAFIAAFCAAEGPGPLSEALAMLFAPRTGMPDGFARAVHRRRADAGLRADQARLAAGLFPQGRQAFDGRAALAAYAGPARVVWGMSDAIIPPHHADALPPAVALHRFGGVGHMPHVEAPAAVARLIGENVRSAR